MGKKLSEAFTMTSHKTPQVFRQPPISTVFVTEISKSLETLSHIKYRQRHEV